MTEEQECEECGGEGRVCVARANNDGGVINDEVWEPCLCKKGYEDDM